MFLLDRGHCPKCNAAHVGTPPLCVFYTPSTHPLCSTAGSVVAVQTLRFAVICQARFMAPYVIAGSWSLPQMQCSTCRNAPFVCVLHPQHAPVMFHSWLSSGGADTRVRCYLSGSVHGDTCFCWIVVTAPNAVQRMSERPLCVCSTPPARTCYVPPLAQ